MHRENSPKPMTAKPRQAIISPVADFLCCGGLSILAVLGLFAYSAVDPGNRIFSSGVDLRDIIVLSVLINFPHFMASYRLLYRSKTQILEHSWASIYIPLILVAMIAVSLLTPSQDPENPEFANGGIVELVTLVAAMLLAWHYTGQAWGMTASFSYLAGIRMQTGERRLIRSGYLALMVFHLVWACLVALGDPKFLFFASVMSPQTSRLIVLYNVVTLLVVLTIPLGIAGFLRVWHRTGIRPPIRAFTPWIAIYLWYALIYFYPKMFLCLQVFHALQYLIFPLRIEMNQYAMRRKQQQGQVLHSLVYYISLVVIGFAVFALPTFTFYLGDEAYAMEALVVGFVNIHHYVIDGAIWKIRNPSVRRDLFAHLSG